MSTEKQGAAAAAVIERERLAFNKTHAAWILVQNQFEPFGDGKPSQESIEIYYAAESDWKVTKAEVEGLALDPRGNAC
jgi:hypothetical protein